MFGTTKLQTTKFLIALLMLLSPMVAHAKWNEAWTAREKVSINAQGLAAAVTQATLVVRLHSGNFAFADAKPDGSDLRLVAADDKTELKFHIEKYDSVNELAIIWVQLPKLDPADKTAHFWVYYGNEKAGPQEDSKGSWDANTAAVFHFDVKHMLFQDASANALTATGNIKSQVAGLLGEAAIFSAEPMLIPASPALKLAAGSGFTYSAWIKPGALPQKATLYSQGGFAIKLDGQKISLESGGTVISGGEIKTAIWQHVAATIGAGKAALYVNGVSVGTGNVAIEDAQTDVKIGEGYSGEMDELELANGVRSEDWIKLAVQGQGVESTLLQIEKAAEGAEAEGSTSYFGVLFRSLTTDAWVVIIILSFMFVISFAVMVSKALLILRTDKANNQFLGHFQNASHDLLELDRNGSHPDSTLFRLYIAGLREIRKRSVDDKELALSGASMDAIKAAIDADLIRETQKLNSKMVLLTIAISGGPFLGLLGTVVGVMITFAAIAAAGDVNVNAIAPGIAAALLATVAGLGVAIPALFGYNYLASRIKNITVNMQIFVDEFVTRVAELYGR
jgi:biopolymer transport protein ExbB